MTGQCFVYRLPAGGKETVEADTLAHIKFISISSSMSRIGRVFGPTDPYWVQLMVGFQR